mmetsp:Transcript_22348/g.53550  ORF Transcript_22348/g.53550 Transcript_22348/m.53550 type:complete len:109 (-) Transcript_22348:172-498(-)
MGKGKGAPDSAHRLKHAPPWPCVQRTRTEALLPYSSAGQSQPIFEITNHLSKKENSKLRKAESMVHYWDARVPFWNGKGSPADLAGQKVRENIKAIECKARNRYDALY